MEWIEIKEIDVVNAVAVAFVMSLVVGIPLAIWTGVIMARLTTFDQTRMATCRILSELINFSRAKNFEEHFELRLKIGQDLAMLQAEFVRLRQVNAAAHANYFLQRILEAPWEDPKSGEFPLSSVNRDAYMRRLADFISAFEKMIFDERPMMSQILTWRGFVSSTEPIKQPDIDRLRRREQNAMKEVLEFRKRQQH